jgi:hypothetical protein
LIVLPLNIYVRGERRDDLALEAQKIPEAETLRLEYDTSEKDSCRGPVLISRADEYFEGAYRFSRSLAGYGSPGFYRVTALAIRYANGAEQSLPLSEDIVIELEATSPPTMQGVIFTAR